MFHVNLIPMICIFAAVSTLIWILLSKFIEREDEFWEERLQTFLDKNKSTQQPETLTSEPKGLLSKVVPKLSEVLDPKDKIENQTLTHLLAQAGFSNKTAVPCFLAIKLASLIACASIGTTIGLSLLRNSDFVGLLGVGGAACGMFLPIIVVKQLAKSRKDRIFLALPGAIDLLVIALEAGTAIDQAVAEVTAEFKTLAPDLTQELDLYCNEMRLGGNRRKALHNLGTRAGVDDLNSMANVLLQADRFGTGIALALREMARISRQKRKQKAEERASKTAVALLIPLILFIFPGIFVILVGPAAITIFRDMISL